MDQYIALRASSQPDGAQPDGKLVAVVERLFERCAFRVSFAKASLLNSPPSRASCLADGQFQHAVGLALECRRLDKVEEAVGAAGPTEGPACVAYALRLCQSSSVSPRDFRRQVLRTLVTLFTAQSRRGGAGSSSGDAVAVCQCLMLVDDAPGVAAQLEALCAADDSEEPYLVALQVAFDLFENDQPEFLQHVAAALAEPAAPAPVPAPGGDEATGMDMGDGAQAPSPPPPSVASVRRATLRSILSGEVPLALQLAFSSSRNAGDVQLLKGLKAAVESRNSVCHGAVVAANAIAHCGTTCDTFLRDNLDWLGRATNWAKFSATASLGAIHKGHVANGRALMAPYLPREGGGGSGSPYAEGGALYALGLMYTQHGGPIRGFLAQCLRGASSEIVQHGACLGLGLASISLGADDPPAGDAGTPPQAASNASSSGSTLFEDLKAVLYTDSAVAGEAAGLAMGLLLAGRSSDKVHELVAYAHDTSHEKIIRGLAVGLALTCYGREEEAQPLVETLCRDADPILRYGGAFAVGLAHRGTGHNDAVARLLHAAVSDVSDDVRRAAVMSLGFVLAGTPEQVPQVVALLAESYNPHVRYGAAMALGLGCVATGNRDALALIEPLASDGTDFVRQGAHIAQALVLLQQPEARVGPFRRQLDKVVADKHEEPLAKMGAILAAGILDAGGRNATIALRSHSGAWRSSAFLGLALFVQHWYWYPMTATLSLALSPSALIGLTPDLVAPVFSVASAAKASTFAYPPPVSATASKEQAKAATAVLSTTAKAKAKQVKKEAEKKAAAAAGADGAAAGASAAGAGAMDTDQAGGADAPAPMDTDGADGAAPAAAKEEAPTAALSNTSRVVPAQERLIRWDEKGRYQPIKRAGAGILIVRDTRPEEPTEVALRLPEPEAAPPAPAAALPVVEEEEPAPPEAFEFTEDAL